MIPSGAGNYLSGPQIQDDKYYQILREIETKKAGANAPAWNSQVRKLTTLI
jgi:hypothetical protein